MATYNRFAFPHQYIASRVEQLKDDQTIVIQRRNVTAVKIEVNATFEDRLKNPITNKVNQNRITNKVSQKDEMRLSQESVLKGKLLAPREPVNDNGANSKVKKKKKLSITRKLSWRKNKKREARRKSSI